MSRQYVSVTSTEGLVWSGDFDAYDFARFTVGDWDIEILADSGDAGLECVVSAAEGIAFGVESGFDDDAESVEGYASSARVVADRVVSTLPQVISCKVIVNGRGCVVQRR